MEIEGSKGGRKCSIFENNLLRDNLFRQNLGRREAQAMQELLGSALSFINLEEKLNTRFNDPVSVDTNSNCPMGKESQWLKDESD